MTQTLWAVDAYDKQQTPSSPTELCERVVGEVSPGAIVVMHDGGSVYTDDALGCIITRLKRQGYDFGQIYPSERYHSLNSSYVRLIERTPPRVNSTSPASNTSGIARGANVKATFSEAMKARTISTTTFKLRKSGANTFLKATVTYDPATKRATLDPRYNLQSGAAYVATVTTGAKDLANNSLDQNSSTAGDQPKTWKFRVR